MPEPFEVRLSDGVAIWCGDCRDVLPVQADAVVTDPPYGLGFMGKDWDHEVPGVEFWRRCFDSLKPGGYLLAFAGTRTQHRIACAIEDAGFEIRDMIAWVYCSGFPKSLDVSKAIDKAAGVKREVVGVQRRSQVASEGRDRPWKHEAMKESGSTVAEFNITAPATEAARQWQGWGTALKPALEPITVARKPLGSTVAECVLAHGTGAINVDGCRVEGAGPSWLKPYTRSTTSEVYALGRSQEGKPVTYTDHPLGRWPANLIHDGSDEVVALFPETTSGRPCGVRSVAGFATVKEHGTPLTGLGDSGSAARFFYCAKASKADRDEGCEGLPMRSAGECVDREEGTAGMDCPRAGAGRINGSRNHHPTVKPTDLMRYLCRLVTLPGGLVLDPFMGSGSTGKAAIREGFRFIGIERDADSFIIARARLEHELRQLALPLNA